MSRRSTRERRKVPYFNDRLIHIPFSFLDESRLNANLDPLDEDGLLMRVATGTHPPREPPYDVLTAWVTLAFIGALEKGGPVLRLDATREERLEAAREFLTKAEMTLVETLAVPKRYRQCSARELEGMIRTAPDHIDRMWAGCWLILTGWVGSADCLFTADELEDMIVDAYARREGVSDADDHLGWMRIDTGYEANLVSHRLTLCQSNYDLNGPPPYEYVEQTIPLGPGWRQTMRLIPEVSNRK